MILIWALDNKISSNRRWGTIKMAIPITELAQKCKLSEGAKTRCRSCQQQNWWIHQIGSIISENGRDHREVLLVQLDRPPRTAARDRLVASPRRITRLLSDWPRRSCRLFRSKIKFRRLLGSIQWKTRWWVRTTRSTFRPSSTSTESQWPAPTRERTLQLYRFKPHKILARWRPFAGKSHNIGPRCLRQCLQLSRAPKFRTLTS